MSILGGLCLLLVLAFTGCHHPAAEPQTLLWEQGKTVSTAICPQTTTVNLLATGRQVWCW